MAPELSNNARPVHLPPHSLTYSRGGVRILEQFALEASNRRRAKIDHIRMGTRASRKYGCLRFVAPLTPTPPPSFFANVCRPPSLHTHTHTHTHTHPRTIALPGGRPLQLSFAGVPPVRSPGLPVYHLSAFPASSEHFSPPPPPYTHW